MRALVLCGGFGTRLGSLAASTPKPLLAAAGRPLLEWIARHLASSGVREILVNTHHHAEQLERAVGDLERALTPLRFELVHEASLLGTAGTVWANRAWLSAEGPFVVHYGDVVHDGDLVGLVRQRGELDAAIAMGIHQNPSSNSVVLRSAEGWVESFVERPDPEVHRKLAAEGKTGWAFSGVCVVSPEALSDWPTAPADLPREVFPRWHARRRLAANALGGSRVAVDSPERLAKLDALLREGRCVPGRSPPRTD